jgi:branched-chain amino acid transport system substrate-binding protein
MRGEEYRDAAIVAIERWKEANGDEIAGHEIEVRAEDDGCSASDVTEVAAQRLLRTAGLVGVIGPQCSGGSVAVIPTYAEAGVVMISGSATTTSLTEEQPEGRFFFRTAYRNDLEGTLIGLFLTDAVPGIESAYIIDDSETYGMDLASNTQRIAEEGGVSVTRESIVQGTVDFSVLAERIAQANPGFVGFAGFNPEAALLYRQLRDAGYEGLFGAGDGAASVVGFVEPVGEQAEGVLFAGCTVLLPQDFLAEFIDLHGHEPTSAFPAQYADAATVLLNAVSVVAVEQDDGSLVIDPIELRDRVRDTVLSGVSGGIAFDENGDRLPPGVASLSQFVDEALANQDTAGYIDLGLIPCQVQDGELVNLMGPDAGEIRLP